MFILLLGAAFSQSAPVPDATMAAIFEAANPVLTCGLENERRFRSLTKEDVERLSKLHPNMDLSDLRRAVSSDCHGYDLSRTVNQILRKRFPNLSDGQVSAVSEEVIEGLKPAYRTLVNVERGAIPEKATVLVPDSSGK